MNKNFQNTNEKCPSEENVNEIILDEENVNEIILGKENVDKENVDEENVDDENVDDENVDKENVDDENVDKENVDDENVDDENVDEENVDEKENNEKKFIKVLKEFLNNLIDVFPELEIKLDNNLKNIRLEEETRDDIHLIKEYIKTIYPERFFDLLYQNENIFTDENINTYFLPNIDFSLLWKEDITDKTRNTIWQYLKLICFSVINDKTSKNIFGDTGKLFEAMDPNILKEKLESTIFEMSDMFDSSNNFNDISKNLPNIEDLHESINKLMKGKLGRLAKEITEETIKDLGDLSGVDSVKDLFNNLFKNPNKLTNLVKKMSDSLDKKMKDGDINESELMEEALEMMQSFKNMPGMDNMQEMFQKMGMPDLTKSNVNLGVMKSKMKQNIKKQKMKERMFKKLQQKKQLKPDNELSQIEILEKKLEEAKEQTNILKNELNKKNTSKVVKKKRRRRRRKKNKK